MNITTQDHAKFIVLELSGRLDADTSDDLSAWVESNITPPVKNVLLDCKDLDYMSSAGLRGFLAILKLMQKNNFGFAVCRPRDYIFEVLEVSGFSSLFPIYDSLEDYIASS